MEQFKQYLQGRGLKLDSIKEFIATVSKFLSWKRNNKIRKVEPENILEFVSIGNLTPRVKNARLNHLRKYFAFQIKEGKMKTNSAIDLKIRITYRKVMKLLHTEELDELFEKYRTRKLTKVSQQQTHVKFLSLIGFVIYQALTSKELMRLRKSDIDLSKGTISIPATERSNARVLKLEARQIIPLSKHLESVNEFLFENRISDLFREVLKHLKQLHYHGITINQIRESRITLWVREYEIRYVQHLTGFKYISSLQKYKNQDIESLKEKVKKYHPFKVNKL
jgi:site-specific recombinase XerD